MASESVEAMRTSLVPLLSEIIERAKAEGALRADFPRPTRTSVAGSPPPPAAERYQRGRKPPA
jgi:hypothetical protein